jgi:pyruvate kinase
MLDAIVREAEGAQAIGPATSIGVSGDQSQALCEAAVTLASRGGAAAIVAITRGGGTARRLAALRPRVPIIAACPREEVARRLALHWGVLPMCVDIADNVDAAGAFVGRELVSRGLVPAGASVVLVSINADLARTDANYLKVQKL